jgi:tetratricopeptide (TPR) repeat protein
MWSPHSTDLKLAIAHPAAALAALLLIAACSSGPERARVPQREAQPVAAASGAAASGSAANPGAPGSGVPGVPGVPAPGTLTPPAPPPEAVADFDRAVSLVRSGSTEQAQNQFAQLAMQYPQFAGAEINLGILYRKSGQLALSERALREAVHRNGSSAVAWNELGLTLRLRGQFRDAAEAYRKAIAADAAFAPAYRNLGVLLDLYLGDAPGALAAFERYKELSGEQKPVSGWIAELRHRVGKSAAPSAGATPPGAAGEAPAPATQSRAPAQGPGIPPADAGE